MRHIRNMVIGSAPALLLLPNLAAAHVLPGASGFVHGLEHPLSGLDHVLAMAAVGLWATQVGGRAVWAVPASFVGAMIVGAALGIAGVHLPGVEAGIAASVLVLGLLIAGSLKVPEWACMTLVAVFAIFHGHAHGAEMVAGASAAAFGAGFVLSTVLLHAVGIAGGLLMRQVQDATLVRITGSSIAACGVLMCLGAFAP